MVRVARKIIRFIRVFIRESINKFALEEKLSQEASAESILSDANSCIIGCISPLCTETMDRA